MGAFYFEKLPDSDLLNVSIGVYLLTAREKREKGTHNDKRNHNRGSQRGAVHGS